MTDNKNNSPPQPFQPPVRGSQHYKNLRREIVGRSPPAPPVATSPAPAVTSSEESGHTPRRRLFDFHLNADIEEGETMDEPHMLLQMAFKPHVTGLKLTLEQSQLILAYLHEILREAEIEEQAIAAEQAMIAVQNTAQGQSTDPNNDEGDVNNDEASPCT